MTSAFPLPPAAAALPTPAFPSGSHLAFPRAPATGISPSQGGPGEAGEVGDGWGAHRCLSSLPQQPPTQVGTTLASTGAANQGSGPRLRIEMAPRGGRDGPDVLGFPPHPPPPSPYPPPLRGRHPRHRPNASPVYKPAFFLIFSTGARRGEAKGGVCAMGRGLGNGSPALGGAAGGFLADPGPGRRTVQLPSHTPPRRPHYIPVHCRTGQSFAHKNRATQPARHTSGEKMAARARRKLPKVPERTGQRAAAAAAERAERAGARLRKASGGARGRGGVGAAAVASPAPPRAWSPPPSALWARACCCGARRPGFLLDGPLRSP